LICGDLIISSLNECEDDNFHSGDGCTNKCQIEKGWDCVGIPSICREICGDKFIIGKEECDEKSDICTDKCLINKDSWEFKANQTIDWLSTASNVF